ncbi:MAG TPA: sortase [Nevskiaceae bacterium]|nr:sortase [Nevskiaceae bacterium]
MAKKPTKKKKKPAELAGTKAKFSFKKHLLPPLGGLLVFVLVFGFFNSQWISGRIAYFINSRTHHTTSKIITISTTKDTTPPPITIPKDAPYKINIPKISVDAPVIYSQTVVNQAAFMQALHDGVVHYPDTAVPGETGNIVIFGHSSGQWWAPGHYKFVFSLLDKTEKGDQISLDYNGIRYVYQITTKHVVLPDDVSVLNTSTDHKLTLITCTPIGTNYKRLIIEANQISPALTHTTATTTTQKTVPVDQNKLPGSAPSFWQNIKDLF